MSRRLFVFRENIHAEELEKIAESVGVKVKRIQNVVIMDNVRDEELIYIFTELSENALKDMRIYEGNFREESCQSLIKAVARAEPPESLIDKLIFNNLGKVFVDTKIFFHAIVDVRQKKIKAFEALCRPPIKIVDLINIGKSTSEFSENFCRYAALKKASKFLGENLLLFMNFHPRFLKDPFKVFGDF